MIKDGMLTEQALELIALGKKLEAEGYELSVGSGTNRKINNELVTKLCSLQQSQPENKKENENDSTKLLEQELARAIVHLRSANTIDSDANDLRILEDMAKITMLVSTLSGRGGKNIDLAKQSINNYSLTTGGAPLQGAVNRQSLKTNAEPMTKALRYHLDQQTASVDINTLPTTEEAKAAKERRNKKYAESAQALELREGK